MKTEIWIGGRLFCEVDQDKEVIENFERIVRKVGYTVIEKEEDGKIRKLI